MTGTDDAAGDTELPIKAVQAVQAMDAVANDNVLPKVKSPESLVTPPTAPLAPPVTTQVATPTQFPKKSLPNTVQVATQAVISVDDKATVADVGKLVDGVSEEKAKLPTLDSKDNKKVDEVHSVAELTAKLGSLVSKPTGNAPESKAAVADTASEAKASSSDVAQFGNKVSVPAVDVSPVVSVSTVMRGHSTNTAESLPPSSSPPDTSARVVRRGPGRPRKNAVSTGAMVASQQSPSIRSPGRPRKNANIEHTSDTNEGTMTGAMAAPPINEDETTTVSVSPPRTPVRRGPGRPRKHAIDATSGATSRNNAATSVANDGVAAPVKRGPGRPRKESNAQKRGPGRPRKNPINVPFGTVVAATSGPVSNAFAVAAHTSSTANPADMHVGHSGQFAPPGSASMQGVVAASTTTPLTPLNNNSDAPAHDNPMHTMAPPQKRGPGRPRKHPVTTAVADGTQPVKRGRGRPRKSDSGGRGPGRPRKYASDTSPATPITKTGIMRARPIQPAPAFTSSAQLPLQPAIPVVVSSSSAGAVPSVGVVNAPQSVVTPRAVASTAGNVTQLATDLGNPALAGAIALEAVGKATPPVKRGRGRPRKPVEPVDPSVPKRGRGRPRKSDTQIGPKRGPGRPRKDPNAPVTPKRRPGRPRKNPIIPPLPTHQTLSSAAQLSVIIPTMQGVEIAPTPPRRAPGRPRKIEDVSVVVQQSNAPVQNAVQPPLVQVTLTGTPKRGPGRPRKTSTNIAMQPAVPPVQPWPPGPEDEVIADSPKHWPACQRDMSTSLVKPDRSAVEKSADGLIQSPQQPYASSTENVVVKNMLAGESSTGRSVDPSIAFAKNTDILQTTTAEEAKPGAVEQKRGRGRPRKRLLEDVTKDAQKKRGRGRPRKNPVDVKSGEPEGVVVGASASPLPTQSAFLELKYGGAVCNEDNMPAKSEDPAPVVSESTESAVAASAPMVGATSEKDVPPETKNAAAAVEAAGSGPGPGATNEKQ